MILMVSIKLSGHDDNHHIATEEYTPDLAVFDIPSHPPDDVSFSCQGLWHHLIIFFEIHLCG